MSNDIDDMMVAWAEHAAAPFHGQKRVDSEKALRVAIGIAIKIGKGLFDIPEDFEFAYSWDKDNRISVVFDRKHIDYDTMAVIRGCDIG